ncbi:GSCOCG00011563001-RA-CDS, partial [Cotesia congregata]
KLIELVPRSWITIDEEDECYCRYPPSEMAQKYMTKWLKSLHEADDSWLSYKVDIKYRATTYIQGLRRLHRAFTSAQATSDPEDAYQPELRNDMVLMELENLLNNTSAKMLTKNVTTASSKDSTEGNFILFS